MTKKTNELARLGLSRALLFLAVHSGVATAQQPFVVFQ